MKQIVQLFSATILVSIASAGEPTPSPTPEPRFKISGWVESGITFNPDSPQSNQNFGRLFDDRANEPLLNQVVINFERALVPQPGQFDWGFKLQFMYGSDARFIHSLGLFDRTTHEILQPDLVEAYLNLHFPVLTEGGLDLKLGKFAPSDVGQMEFYLRWLKKHEMRPGGERETERPNRPEAVRARQAERVDGIRHHHPR